MKKDAIREVGGGCFLLLVWLLMFAVVSAVFLSMCSCSTQKAVLPERVSVDTLILTRFRVDSIVRHDSVYIKEQRRNDTVWIDRYRYRTLLRDKAVHDTLVQIKTDTVTVTKISHQLTKKDEVFGVLGRLLVWVLSGLMFFVGLRFLLKR